MQTVKKGKKKDFWVILEWSITPPLEFVTLELIYFLNSDMDSGSNHVSGSQAFENMVLYSIYSFRRSMWRWEPWYIEVLWNSGMARLPEI